MLNFAEPYELKLDYMKRANLRQKSGMILIWRNLCLRIKFNND